MKYINHSALRILVITAFAWFSTSVLCAQPYTNMPALVQLAFTDEEAQASGWVGGSLADMFNQQMGIDAQAVHVRVVRLEKIADECGRFEFTLEQPGHMVEAIGGQREARFVFQSNVCLDGSPPVSTMK